MGQEPASGTGGCSCSRRQGAAAVGSEDSPELAVYRQASREKVATRADNYPRILEMLQIIDDAIGDDSQETAVVPEDDTAAERDESGEIMDAWGIQPPQQPESIEEKLQAKSKAVLLDLQDKQVQIEDSDEAPGGLQGLPL